MSLRNERTQVHFFFLFSLGGVIFPTFFFPARRVSTPDRLEMAARLSAGHTIEVSLCDADL